MQKTVRLKVILLQRSHPSFSWSGHWIRGAGYVLTGLMVRKAQDMQEESKENLDIIGIISEYQESCIQDIRHLPVVEKEKKR